MYEDEDYDVEPRKSPLIPILAVVAGVLFIAVGVVAVMFAMGFFDRGPATVATAEPPPASAPASAGVTLGQRISSMAMSSGL